MDNVENYGTVTACGLAYGADFALTISGDMPSFNLENNDLVFFRRGKWEEGALLAIRDKKGRFFFRRGFNVEKFGGVLLLGGPDDEPINLKEEEPGTYEIMEAAICMQRRFIRGPLYEKKEDEE